MADQPRRYLQEFKYEAVALALSSERPIAQTARSLGLSDRTWWNWVNHDRKAGARASDPSALSTEDLAELKRVRATVCERRCVSDGV